MTSPHLSIIIPTHNRPQLLLRAVKSALEQTLEDLEVIVVDDASIEKATLPNDPRLKVIYLEQSRGGAGARNVGLEAAQGKWITYLDDDDRLLPHLAEVSIAALEKVELPPPIAVISGIEVIDPEGNLTSTRLPPPLRRQGAHFALEPLEAGRSYNTKQTMVVEREVLEQIGGWDESFRSRVHSELFLRLNAVCSIVGLPTVTYQLQEHPGDRVSNNRSLRQESFLQLIAKHRAVFESHPRMFANFVYENAYKAYTLRLFRLAFANFCWALKLHPSQTLIRFLNLILPNAFERTL
jgi:glycosyltransferase involved in cell wall biosynthesis